MLEQGIVTCVTSPPLNQQPTRRKRNQDEPVFVGSRTTEKGKVYCDIYGMIMLREKLAFLSFV